ncbi:ATP-grasp domain-containing protein [Klebsiella aerogenes]
MNKAILILSHQLLSMVAPIKKIVEDNGYACYVLSSTSSKATAPQWEIDEKQFSITSSLYLEKADIDLFLQTTGKNVDFAGCLSVWDGYRHLMSYANHIFGARDIGEEVVARLRDKLVMRQVLQAAGLTAVTSQVLNEALFESISHPEQYFIKPRIGLASMGTFPAKSLTEYAQIEHLWMRAAEDKNYEGIFSRDNGFILEGFISGVECSFEIAIDNGVMDVLAVHEKLDVTQETYSVLEGACICPPRSLTTAQVEAGKVRLDEIMKALGADTGVYHVEMKFDPQLQWEVVEINPRIGGAYIVDSTKIHSGACLLETWLMLILGRSHVRSAAPARTTFFRVFFGQSGKTLLRIQRSTLELPAVQEKVLYKALDKLPSVEREIFLGMALWDITDMAISEHPIFFKQTNDYLITEYQ